jgi:ribosomal protein S12 methylthiotransferase accessory factor
MHLSDFERSVSVEYGKGLIPGIITSFASNYGVSLREYEMVPKCFVAEGAEGEITSGFGKGSQAAIGAFGECIEHFHLLNTGNNWSKYAIRSKKSALYQADIFVRVGSNFIPDSEEISALPFEELGNGISHLMPFSLVNGDFPQENASTNDAARFFSRYASSSGTAFGFSRNDALLHAILEVIERDEISKLFLNLLGGYGDGKPYHYLNRYGGLHHEVSALYDKLKGMACVTSVETLVRKTAFGAYFAFSRLLREPLHEGKVIWGAGASISYDLAVYRSMTECEQMASVQLPSKGGGIEELAKRYPAFGAVARIDTARLSLSHHTFEQDTTAQLDVEKQIELLNKSIRASGRAVLYYDHDVADGNYSVVSSYITDTEKFFGIMFALPLLPIAHLRKYDGTPVQRFRGNA